MTMIYSYERAKKSFDLIFKKAALNGKVEIRKDDQLYVLMPASKNKSPLDVEGVDLGISTKDIIELIHESRRS
jgi:hypothetical protein